MGLIRAKPSLIWDTLLLARRVILISGCSAKYCIKMIYWRACTVEAGGLMLFGVCLWDNGTTLGLRLVSKYQISPSR
jgi:hypothetical protein